MAFEVRGISVVSGSTTIHKFLDNAESLTQTTFNKTSKPGSFSVSGSSDIGLQTNSLSSGTTIHGLMRVPSWDKAVDATQIEALVGAELSNGTFNGSLFYMSSKAGYTGANTIALWSFPRGETYYFCKNGRWYAGPYVPISDPPPAGDPNEGFKANLVRKMTEKFETAGSWSRTLSIASLAGFSGFAAIVDTDTLDVTATDLSSFSDFTGGGVTNSFTNAFAHAEGFFGTSANIDTDGIPTTTDFSSPTVTFIETVEHGQGFFGTSANIDANGIPTTADFDSPDNSFVETVEHGNGFFGTATGIDTDGIPTAPDFSSPSVTFTETVEHGQGFYGTAANIDANGIPTTADFDSPDNSFVETYDSW